MPYVVTWHCPNCKETFPRAEHNYLGQRVCPKCKYEEEKK